MSDFLAEMAAASAARVAEARRGESLDALERRARQTPLPPTLVLSPDGFDVIAELKRRSPAMGVLRDASDDWLERVVSYARAGAAAVSVLTEPSRFDGSLDDLREAARVLAPLDVPAMRKDFLVDPYQVLEARAAGASGVLVILRMLHRDMIAELLAAAAEHGLFVLLEAFDSRDLELARELLAAGAHRVGSAPTGEGFQSAASEAPVLVGVNCRDLSTLSVVPGRFAELAPLLPPGAVAVAESGVATDGDACRVRRLGYRLALIGTALMKQDDPAALLVGMLRATRAQ
jgi:indole-3-glycerol phosphate synthase